MKNAFRSPDIDDSLIKISDVVPHSFRSIFKYDRFNAMQSIILPQAMQSDVSGWIMWIVPNNFNGWLPSFTVGEHGHRRANWIREDSSPWAGCFATSSYCRCARYKVCLHRSKQGVVSTKMWRVAEKVRQSWAQVKFKCSLPDMHSVLTHLQCHGGNRRCRHVKKSPACCEGQYNCHNCKSIQFV